MLKQPTLEELKDGRFATEPMKGKKNPKIDWTPNSRHLLIHTFFNVLGEPLPRNASKTKLPSLDADRMRQMSTDKGLELGARISKWRSEDRSISSIQGAIKFCHPDSEWDLDQTSNGTGHRALIQYETMKFDCVERIYARSKQSVPLNIDKRARNSFKADWRYSYTGERLTREQGSPDWVALINPEGLQFLCQVQKVETERDGVSLETYWSRGDWPVVADMVQGLHFPYRTWFGFDWSRAELFMLYVFSGDEVLKEALLSADFHQYTASRIYMCDLESVTPEQRNIAKTLIFALIYSGFDFQTTLFNALNDDNKLKREDVEYALQRIQTEYNTLFNWVGVALRSWYESDGNVHYLMGAYKHVEVSEWLKPDLEKLKKDKNGRVAINTYGQNSVGLLLKRAYSKIYRDSVLRASTHCHIPMFDAMYMHVDTNRLLEVSKRMAQVVNVTLRHMGREITMEAEFNSSVRSWGAMLPVEVPVRVEGSVIQW